MKTLPPSTDLRAAHRSLALLVILTILLAPVRPFVVRAAGLPLQTPNAPMLTVQAATANVRSGPGATFPVIGAAKKDQRYTVTGRDQGTKWWQVDFQGRPGWIAATLVKTDVGSEKAPVVSVAVPDKTAATAASTPAATAAPPGPALPPFQDALTLGAGTTYPVRAGSVAGWGYELVDASKDFDVILKRDIFGVFLNQLWPDLLAKHQKGLRITFKDADPSVNYPARYEGQGGFGDGESAYVYAAPCQTEHEEHNTIWQNEQVLCEITLVSPGPGMTDIGVMAAVLGYGRTREGNQRSPVFDRDPFTLLGQATRDAESGQWRWRDPFLQIVSLRPAAAPAAAATAAPKVPLPPPSGHIAFTLGRDDNGPTPAGISDIALLDVKTGEMRVVAQNGRQPDVRNDGRIVFNGEGSGRDDLQVVSPDGNYLGPISMHPEDSAPNWSSGASLAFHSTLAGGLERIFVQWDGDHRTAPQFLEVDNGSNLRPLTGRYPVWVGGQLAYTGCDEWARRSVCGIRLVDLAALMKSKQRTAISLVTKNPDDRATDVAGSTILFSSPQAGNWDLYTVPATGGKARRLTTEPSQDAGGAFSPDGNYIAYMSNRGGWGIWIMEADGLNPRLLLAVPGGFGKLWDQDRLSWGP